MMYAVLEDEPIRVEGYGDCPLECLSDDAFVTVELDTPPRLSSS